MLVNSTPHCPGNLYDKQHAWAVRRARRLSWNGTTLDGTTWVQVGWNDLGAGCKSYHPKSYHSMAVSTTLVMTTTTRSGSSLCLLRIPPSMPRPRMMGTGCYLELNGHGRGGRCVGAGRGRRALGRAGQHDLPSRVAWSRLPALAPLEPARARRARRTTSYDGDTIVSTVCCVLCPGSRHGH